MEGKDMEDWKDRTWDRFAALNEEMEELVINGPSMVKSHKNDDIDDRRNSFNAAVNKHLCSTLNNHMLWNERGVNFMVKTVVDYEKQGNPNADSKTLKIQVGRQLFNLMDTVDQCERVLQKKFKTRLKKHLRKISNPCTNAALRDGPRTSDDMFDFIRFHP